MRADAPSSRMSQQVAMPKPAPTAGPFTAAITGTSQFAKASTVLAEVPR